MKQKTDKTLRLRRRCRQLEQNEAQLAAFFLRYAWHDDDCEEAFGLPCDCGYEVARLSIESAYGQAAPAGGCAGDTGEFKGWAK